MNSSLLYLIQESIHFIKRKGDKGMISDMDMANAFDQIRHSFMIFIMFEFGFFENSIAWMKATLTILGLILWLMN